MKECPKRTLKNSSLCPSSQNVLYCPLKKSEFYFKNLKLLSVWYVSEGRTHHSACVEVRRTFMESVLSFRPHAGPEEVLNSLSGSRRLAASAFPDESPPASTGSKFSVEHVSVSLFTGQGHSGLYLSSCPLTEFSLAETITRSESRTDDG